MECRPTTSPTRTYTYDYDRAGNRTRQTLTTLAGVTSNYTYNNANQLVNEITGSNSFSYTYDRNGNLRTRTLSGGATDTYTWDRANRLLSLGTTSYLYYGDGNRISQTTGGQTTAYLLDLAAGLPTILTATEGTNITCYMHGPFGIHAEQNPAPTSNWDYHLQDGLGSVRSVVTSGGSILETRQYSPYGVPFGTSGTNQSAYGFTGEPTDSNGLVYLRARYYHPSIGVFPSLDPFEGVNTRAMSVNGYSWVEGNGINATDPSGLSTLNADKLAKALNKGFCGSTTKPKRD